MSDRCQRQVFHHCFTRRRPATRHPNYYMSWREMNEWCIRRAALRAACERLAKEGAIDGKR